NETQLLKYEIGGNQKINLVYQKPVVQLVYECYRNNDNLIFENKNFREGSIEVDMKKFMKPNGSECHKRQTGDHILRYHHTDNYNHVGIIRYSRVKCRKYINILRDTQFVHNNTILQSYNQDFIRTLVVIEFDKAVSLNDFPVRSADADCFIQPTTTTYSAKINKKKIVNKYFCFHRGTIIRLAAVNFIQYICIPITISQCCHQSQANNDQNDNIFI
ncbi:unnamed protein product, partial [Rotaria sordida]